MAGRSRARVEVNMQKLCEDPGHGSTKVQAEWRHRFSFPTVDGLVNAFLLLCWKHVNASARKAQKANIGGFVEPLLLPDAPGAPIGSEHTTRNYWAQEELKIRQEVVASALCHVSSQGVGLSE